MVDNERLAELAPADLVARVGATPRWCWGHDRPLQGRRARALGRGLLLTTHFSGADEPLGGPEQDRSGRAGTVGRCDGDPLFRSVAAG
jgi:hypothetical protein